MLSDFSGADRVYIACGYTDIRKGIDGLAALAQHQFRLNPCSNSLFCGRRRDRIKALYWEADGFLLLYGNRMGLFGGIRRRARGLRFLTEGARCFLLNLH